MSVQIEHLPNGFIRARDRASGLEALFYRNGEVRGGNGSIPAFVNTRATLMLREADRLDRLNAGHPSPSWSEGCEATRLRRRAAELQGRMI